MNSCRENITQVNTIDSELDFTDSHRITQEAEGESRQKQNNKIMIQDEGKDEGDGRGVPSGRRRRAARRTETRGPGIYLLRPIGSVCLVPGCCACAAAASHDLSKATVHQRVCSCADVYRFSECSRAVPVRTVVLCEDSQVAGRGVRRGLCILHHATRDVDRGGGHALEYCRQPRA